MFTAYTYVLPIALYVISLILIISETTARCYSWPRVCPPWKRCIPLPWYPYYRCVQIWRHGNSGSPWKMGIYGSWSSYGSGGRGYGGGGIGYGGGGMGGYGGGMDGYGDGGMGGYGGYGGGGMDGYGGYGYGGYGSGGYGSGGYGSGGYGSGGYGSGSYGRKKRVSYSEKCVYLFYKQMYGQADGMTRRLQLDISKDIP
ncbi:unnamed protein product [Mytilus coruscus]|uniref:Uncharacterized protein n=1 Tax=Mytilus coruscus TaxID=42192 RepID=A0A6J8CEC2_MYTCO|nr:unnamed protein product [Mytilus coruscus]